MCKNQRILYKAKQMCYLKIIKAREKIFAKTEFIVLTYFQDDKKSANERLRL